MNRFVVAEPLWCTGCNTCLAACSDVHKTQGLQQHPRLALAKTSTLLRWEPGVQTVAVKCDLCDFLPEGPACVRACPNQALRLITDDSLQRQMKEKQRLAASWFANGGEDPLSLTQEQH
ncbi:hypothetical protein JOW62_04315 [Escherichia coli]